MFDMISVRIPVDLLELLDKKVQAGDYASRSEAIRIALRDFYKNHFEGKIVGLKKLEKLD
jgi:Arc/MetJ-type ribon-helix-helix transcriptional regulator